MVKGDDEGVCESDCEGGCDKQTDKLMDGHTDIGNCRVTFVINSIFNAITTQYHQSLITRNTTCYTGYISFQDCDGSGLSADVTIMSLYHLV